MSVTTRAFRGGQLRDIQQFVGGFHVYHQSGSLLAEDLSQVSGIVVMLGWRRGCFYLKIISGRKISSPISRLFGFTN